MTNLHSKSIIHEIFGFLLILILVILVLSQYNKPIITAATDQVKEYPYLSNIINSPIAQKILNEDMEKSPKPDKTDPKTNETPKGDTNPEPEPPKIDEKWVALWGKANAEDSTLTIAQDEGSVINGAFAYLDTSYASNDYDYKTELSGANAEKISLLVRVQDSQSYTSCYFENGSIKIIQTSESGDRIITEKWVNDQTAVLNPGTILTASVVGQKVSCSFNEQVLVAEVSEMHPQGVAGVKVEEFHGTYMIPANENNPMRFGGGYPVIFSRIEVTPIIAI